MKALIELILIFTVFLIPLLPAHLNYGYEQIKVLFFVVLLSLAAFCWVYLYFQNPSKNQIKWTDLNKSALSFVTILFLTSIGGIDFTRSFLGEYPYFQGLILYLYLYLFYLLVSFTKIPNIKWGLVLALSSLIVSLVAIWQWVQLEFLDRQIMTYAGRVISTFGQPNLYSGFILLSLPFSYILAKQEKYKIVGILNIIFAVFAIFLSQSRAAILGVFIILLLWVLKLTVRKLNILALISLFVLLFIILSPKLIEKEILNPLRSNDPDLVTIGVEKRVYLWPSLVQVILQKPLTGYGLENISLSLSTYFQQNKHQIFEENLKINPVLISLKNLNIDRAHNYILDLVLFSGLSGLVSWLILVVLLLKRTKKDYFLVSLIIYLVWTQFQIQSIVHLVYFWLLVGLIDQNST
ncbi:O-antigen ligase family protein [Candidatus Daviesbacteria bacterium]|nr:O-antigen ligase family protein [Candidatus Daviesbacteria bacterium]